VGAGGESGVAGSGAGGSVDGDCDAGKIVQRERGDTGRAASDEEGFVPVGAAPFVYGADDDLCGGGAAHAQLGGDGDDRCANDDGFDVQDCGRRGGAEGGVWRGVCGIQQRDEAAGARRILRPRARQ
jgi:hypothetical protein